MRVRLKKEMVRCYQEADVVGQKKYVVPDEKARKGGWSLDHSLFVRVFWDIYNRTLQGMRELCG